MVSEETQSGGSQRDIRATLPVPARWQADPVKLSLHASAPTLSAFFSSESLPDCVWVDVGPCFMVSAILAIFQCWTPHNQLWLSISSAKWPLVMSPEIEPESSLNFCCPRWLRERSDITEFRESRCSRKPGDFSTFLTIRLCCPFVKMLIPTLPYKSRFLRDGLSMSNRGRSKAPVASEVGCLIGPQRELLCDRTSLSQSLCTSGLIYMFASRVIFTEIFEFDLLV